MELHHRMESVFFSVLAVAISIETGSALYFSTPEFDFRPEIDPDFAPIRRVSYITNKDRREVKAIHWNEVVEEPTSDIPPQFAAFVCPFHFGNFADPENCSSYYNCMYKKPRKKKCPKKKLFDKISRVCVAEDKAVCADKDDNNEHQKIDFKCPYFYGSYAHEKDCSKYYLCLFGKPALKTCDPGKLFDKKKEKCMREDRVNCGSRFNPYETTTEVTTATNQRKDLSTTKMTTNSISVSTLDDNLTLPTTASPEDETSTTSDHDISSPKDQLTTIEDDKSSTESIAVDETSAVTDEIPTTTEITTLTADEGNASSTSILDESTTKERITESSSASIADSTTGVTSTEAEQTSSTSEEMPYSTESGNSTLHTEDNTIAVSTRSTSEETTETTETTKGPETPFVCPKKKGKFAFEGDCSKYYQCKGFNATLEDCGEGMLFHEEFGFCYDGKSVDCGHRKRPESTTTSDLTTAESEIVSTVQPATTLTTPSETVVETQSTTATVEMTTNSGTSTEEIKDFVCPKRKGKFLFEGDCSKFYNCKAFNATLEECGAGTLFDEVRGFCYNEREVDCGTRKRPDPKGTVDFSDTEEATTDELLTDPSREISTEAITRNTPEICAVDDESCTTDEVGLVLRCPETDGMFPHPTDNTQYIECVRSKIFVRKCPDKLIFNPQFRVCVWPK